MKEYILDNGIKLIVGQRDGNITSFCIGFNAGALEESDYNEGVAHAVEHMLFKGTLTRSEKQINDEIDEYFGFSNAMTNYPYAIYYGTVINKDFYSGLELYSDILLNPTFSIEGFQEEINIIKEELRDWREDKNQRCEDLLLANAFSKMRVKELIIGNENSIDRISIEELKKFYKDFYYPGNCVISVVSSIAPEEVYNTVNSLFGAWEGEGMPIKEIYYEENVPNKFINKDNIEGVKLQVACTIHKLSQRELHCLSYFNAIFGEGTSSILFDEIRTKKGLAYEVGSTVKKERGIKLFTIYISTSKEKIDEALEAVFNCISKAKKFNWKEDDIIERIRKRLSLKESLSTERSIELCKRVTTHQLMYGTYENCLNEFDKCPVTPEDIINVVKKILTDATVQILL